MSESEQETSRPITPEEVHLPVISWYQENARNLPWREESCSAWGVLVSEIMLQQTPVSRVLPRWQEWMRRWPEPRDAAYAPPAEILQVWDRLGYPRRALRLQAAAQSITENYDGELPTDADTLRQLPGLGEYTAAAVTCFAFGKPEVVVDTNIRRVHARIFSGDALPGKTFTSGQRALARDVFPDTSYDDGEFACTWNIAAMELGALICTARSPACQQCPVSDLCAWRRAGSPPATEQQRGATQAWVGTDRRVRGTIMALLREHRTVDLARVLEQPLAIEADAQQRRRCVDSLIADRLIETDGVRLSLPGVLSGV